MIKLYATYDKCSKNPEARGLSYVAYIICRMWCHIMKVYVRCFNYLHCIIMHYEQDGSHGTMVFFSWYHLIFTFPGCIILISTISTQLKQE